MNDLDHDIMKLAKEMFNRYYKDSPVTFDTAPYSLARPYINDAARILGWKPLEGDK